MYFHCFTVRCGIDLKVNNNNIIIWYKIYLLLLKLLNIDNIINVMYIYRDFRFNEYSNNPRGK